MTKLDTNALFTQYLNVVNKAIGAHGDETPYRQILQMGEGALGDEPIAVGVYKEDSTNPHDWFEIRLEGGTFDLKEHHKPEGGITWRVKDEHLEQVVDNPQEFIDHPYKLDLDWLKTRLGI